MEGQITERTKNYLSRFFQNPKELDIFLNEHQGVDKDELFRLASMGKGKAKSHMSGYDEEEPKAGYGVGVSHRKNHIQKRINPFKLNSPPR